MCFASSGMHVVSILPQFLIPKGYLSSRLSLNINVEYSKVMNQLINYKVLYFMLYLDYFEFKRLNEKGQVNFTLITN